jgi:histidinol-phosphatase (PHP family)
MGQGGIFMHHPLVGLSDYHMHTVLCGHASGTMDAYISRALELGLDAIGFSEHIYLYHLPPDQRDPELAPHDETALARYVSWVEEAQARYPQLIIRLGLEADYIPGHEATLARILARWPFDYVYGSVHFIDGWGLDDRRYIDGYKDWDPDALYERYFGLVCDAAKTGLFDIMAHLDLVKKFGCRPTRDMTDLYTHVAATLAEAGVCIEVSSGGLRYEAAEIYPAPQLLALCRAAGVPIVLGSDAHQPEHVGYAFTQLLDAAHAAGYTERQLFISRRRASMPLVRAAGEVRYLG